MKKLIFSLLMMAMVAPVLGCTTAIVSGKSTPDGRPLLWKLRDTGTLDNCLRYFNDGPLAFTALVNARDTNALVQVWSGVNEAGLAIMNSASFNLRGADTAVARDREGMVMHLALRYCKTLADFEHMLDTMARPWGVEANFGVIDAQGGAAYYETDNYHYTKFDVNDPVVAPNGYIIRTNYSNTGTPHVGYGFIRYQTVQDMFYRVAGEGELDLDFILNDVSRSQRNALTDSDLLHNDFNAAHDVYRFNRDCVARYETASSVIIQGVLKNEPAALTTMWATVGNPHTTLTLPVWNSNLVQLPRTVVAGEQGTALVCDYGMQWKRELYPIRQGSGSDYIRINRLHNQQGTGMLCRVMQADARLQNRAMELLDAWRRSGEIDKKELKAYYHWLDEQVNAFYR